MDDRGDVATFSHCDVTMTTYHDISTIRAGLHCDIEMPTSSQAMILKSRHLDEKFTDFRKLCESERASPVSSVDLNDLFKESCRAVGEEFLKCYLKGSKEKVRAKLIKLLENKKLISKLQEAATTSGNHSWRAGSDEQVAHRVRPKTSVPAAHRSPREERSEARSKSATGAKVDGHIPLGMHTGLPENIVSLGFRRPAKKSIRRGAKSAPAVTEAEACQMHKNEEMKKDVKPNHDIRVIIARTKKEEIVLAETLSDEPTPESFIQKEDDACAKYEDLCLPAVSLRKKPAEKRPLTVCFSLRDNESVTHKELKDHIEAGLGVKIMRLQYEPLSIRSGDPSINGRWLATLRNLFEVDTMLRKGFYMNGYHMIVKRWNDVAEREYRNYMYYKDVANEPQGLVTKFFQPFIYTTSYYKIHKGGIKTRKNRYLPISVASY